MIYHYLNQEFLTMSGVESNPGPYDSDDEYYDDFETVPLDETTLKLIITECFKLEKLEELLAKVLSMKTIEDCLDLVRVTGSITDRVDIYPWKPESMIHFVGLLKFSINIIGNGGSVHLIEGCNSSFRRFIGDLDILWSYEGKYHISDLTYNLEASSSYLFDSKRYSKGKVFDEKMLKLSYILQNSEVNRSVLRYDYDFKICPDPIEFSMDVPSSCDDEFDCTERMIDFFQKAKISDYSTHRLELLETLSLSLDSHNNLGKYKHRSDLKVNEIFHDRIREHISENKAGYGELIESLGENVFKNHFDSIEQMSIKPSIKFPRFKVRSEDFDEDKEIMRLLSKSKGFPFEVYKALAGLESNVIVKKIDMKPRSGSVANQVKNTTYRVTFLKGSLIDYKDRLPYSHRMTIDELEEHLDSENDYWMSKEGNSLYCDDMTNMVLNSFDEESIDVAARHEMIKTMSFIKDSRLMELVESNAMVYEHLAHNIKKYRMNKGGSHFDGANVNISISLDGRREFLVISNLTSSIKSIKETICYVVGTIIDDSCLSIIPHHSHNTNMIFVSPDELNWGVICLHKFVSVISMLHDIRQSSMTETMTKKRINPFYIFGLLMVNKTTFSNSAEIIRYLLINSTGVSEGSEELFTKLLVDERYKTKNLFAKVFNLRSLKMTYFMEIAESNRFKRAILGDFCSKGFEKSDKDITKSTNWKIAMPYESSYLPSDDNLFDAIYFCKFLYHEHSNVVYREAKTMIKEIKNCLEFSECEKGQWSKKFECHDFYDLIDLLKSSTKESYGKYKPLPAVSLLSVFENTYRMIDEDQDFETFADFWRSRIDDYDLKKNFTIRNVLNARGSMTNDNVVFQTSKLKFVDSSDKVKTRLVNQTSKCWKTSLLNVVAFMENVKIPSLIDKQKHKSEPVLSRDIETKDINMLLRSPENLMSVHIHNVLNKSQYASRAIHKNGRGSGNSYREIHVMNSPMRIGCFFLESLSRTVRDSYHKKNIFSNVMELKTKDSIAQGLFNKYARERKTKEDVVFFDSADCSAWGPSMLSYVLCFHVASRISNKSLRSLCISTYKLFSQKIFKLPDAMILNMTTGKEGLVPPVADFMKLCNSKVYNDECKFLINPQGMGQGLCGSGSGLLQDDNLYLSSVIFKNFSVTSKSVMIDFVNTSDDYSEFIRTELKGDHSVLQSMSEHTHIVSEVQKMSGITRNKKKSTKSGHMSEFNSVYRTVNGCFNSELKIRNSFIDCPFDYDYSALATWACEQSKEALRKGLGFIGSSWIHLINNHIVLLMGGMISQARTKGFGFMHKIPLELGGIIRVNPSKNLILGKFYQNFENAAGINIMSLDDEAIKYVCKRMENLFIQYDPVEVGDILVDQVDDGDDSKQILIPKLSKSGLINLSCRRNKDHRSFEEAIRKIDPHVFSPLSQDKSSSSILKMILSIPQRMMDDTSHSDTCIRFVMPQTPLHSNIYYVNCPVLKALFKTNIISRADIIRHQDSKTVDFDEIEPSSTFFSESSLCDKILEIKKISKDMKPLRRNKEGKPTFDLVYINKSYQTTFYNVDYAIDGSRSQYIDEMKAKFLPISLGGRYDIHPYDYFKTITVLSSRIEKYTINRGKILIPTTFGDEQTSDYQKSIVCNFVEGMRLVSGKRKVANTSQAIYQTIRTCLSLYTDSKSKKTDKPSDVMSPLCADTNVLDVTKLVGDWSELNENHRDLLVNELMSIQGMMNRKFVVNRNKFSPRREPGKSSKYEYNSQKNFGKVHNSILSFKDTNWESNQAVYDMDYYSKPKYENDVKRTFFVVNQPDYFEVSLLRFNSLIFLCLNKPEKANMIQPICRSNVPETTDVVIKLKSHKDRFTRSTVMMPLLLEDEFERVIESSEDYVYKEPMNLIHESLKIDTVIEEEPEEHQVDMMDDEEFDAINDDFDSFLNDCPDLPNASSSDDSESDDDEEFDLNESSLSENKLDPTVSMTEFKIIIVSRTKDCVTLRMKLPYKSSLREISHNVGTNGIDESIYQQIRSDMIDNAEDVDYCSVVIDMSLRGFLQTNKF